MKRAFRGRLVWEMEDRAGRFFRAPLPSETIDGDDDQAFEEMIRRQVETISTSIPLWWDYARYLPMASENYLLTVIASGLGNRILGLLASLQFAALTGRRLLFHWVSQLAGQPMQYGVTVPFSDLWVPQTSLYREISAEELHERTHSIGVSLVYSRGPNWLVNYADVQHAKSPHVFLPTVMACERAPFPLSAFSRFLMPTAEIAQRVDAFRHRHFTGRKVLSAVVRTRAVTGMTAWASPPSWFIQRITEFLRQHPDWRLFLSIDDHRMLSPFVSELPSGVDICYQNKTAPFASNASMKDALVDMYLLGYTDHMLAPWGSTFHMAALALRKSRQPMTWETSQGVKHFFESEVV